MTQGLLLVDKPAGWTSFDVVNYVRRLIATKENKRPKEIKVGHSGTLDPFATGLLVLLVGKDYTKKASKYSLQNKVYEVTMVLGSASSTGDTEAEIIATSDKKPTVDQLKTCLNKFLGQSLQTPPIYSAIKVDGQRAYKLARRGQAVKLEARKIQINSLKVIDYNYPEIRLIADVSSGTYIRSLVEDIGNCLKTGAYTSALKRLSIGQLKLDQAVKPKALNTQTIEQLLLTES